MTRRNEFVGVIAGIALVIVINIAVFILLILLLGTINILPASLVSVFNPLTYQAIYAMGITQLFYAIPLIIWLNQQQKWGLMKGIIIGMIITALLNGGCWVILASYN